ncbi:MAG: hypothetical protein WCK51_08870 [Armatimonadota bacterium]
MIKQNGDPDSFCIGYKVSKAQAALSVVALPLQFGAGLFGNLDLKTGRLEYVKNIR